MAGADAEDVRVLRQHAEPADPNTNWVNSYAFRCIDAFRRWARGREGLHHSGLSDFAGFASSHSCTSRGTVPNSEAPQRAAGTRRIARCREGCRDAGRRSPAPRCSAAMPPRPTVGPSSTVGAAMNVSCEPSDRSPRSISEGRAPAGRWPTPLGCTASGWVTRSTTSVSFVPSSGRSTARASSSGDGARPSRSSTHAPRTSSARCRRFASRRFT